MASICEPTGKFLSIDDVAEMFGCSSRHVQNLVASGDLPKPFKLGRLSRWSPEAIQESIQRLKDAAESA